VGEGLLLSAPGVTVGACKSQYTFIVFSCFQRKTWEYRIWNFCCQSACV